MSTPNFSRFYVLIAHGKHEKEVFAALDKLRLQIPEKYRWTQEITTLKCGDIMIGSLIDEEPHQRVIENLGGTKYPIKVLNVIERKAIRDFCDSYNSGHLSSQRARMMTLRDETGCNAHLVVEDFAEACKKAKRSNHGKISGTRFTEATCLQAFTSIRERDRIFVTHVCGFDGHADFLLRCLKTNEKYKLYCQKSKQTVQQIYNQSLKLNNKGNMTPQLHFQDSLARIPMVSMEMAEKIVEVFPSLIKLLEVLKENDGVKQLENIKVGKNRLGPVKANRIKEYLLN